jgi:hypothetical protein
LSELDKVAVLLVVHLDDTPWVATTADLAAFGCLDLGVGTDDGEWHLRHDLVVLGDRLLVVELVAGTLEDVDVVVVNVGENLSESVQDTESHQC